MRILNTLPMNTINQRSVQKNILTFLEAAQIFNEFVGGKKDPPSKQKIFPFFIMQWSNYSQICVILTPNTYFSHTPNVQRPKLTNFFQKGARLSTIFLKTFSLRGSNVSCPAKRGLEMYFGKVFKLPASSVRSWIRSWMIQM